MAITWDQIGAQSFIRLDGDLSSPGTEVEEITRGGVDGRAFTQIGDRGGIRQLRGLVDVTSEANANTLIDTYKAIQGTVVSIVLRGQTRTNMLVLSVETTGRKNLAVAAGGVQTGSGVYLVESQWTVVYVGT